VTQTKGALSFLICGLAFACGDGRLPEDPTSQPLSVNDAVNRVHRVRSQLGIGGGSNNLVDHGGRVVPAINFYVIYWGTGFGANTPTLVNSFLSGIGASGYWSIDSQYLRGAGNTAAFKGSWTDASSPGAAVLDSDIQGEVTKAIDGGKLPYDANGLYFVFTPPSTTVCLVGIPPACSCAVFCGYHSNYTATGHGNVLYSSIPSPSACPSSCSTQTTTPTGNFEADAAVSIVAHEAEETQSDGMADAWYDATGNENGDKCAWKFGPTHAAANGAAYNQSWSGYNWLVQMNWSNQITGCAQQGPTDGPYAN
jgi:hypothetical protein